MTDKCPNCGFTVELSPRERRALTAELEQLQAQVDSLQQRVHLCAAYDKLQARNEKLEDENKVLRQDVLEAQDTSCEAYARIEKLEADLHKYGGHISGVCQLLNPKPDGTTTWIPKCTCGFTADVEEGDD